MTKHAYVGTSSSRDHGRFLNQSFRDHYDVFDNSYGAYSSYSSFDSCNDMDGDGLCENEGAVTFCSFLTLGGSDFLHNSLNLFFR